MQINQLLFYSISAIGFITGWYCTLKDPKYKDLSSKNIFFKRLYHAINKHYLYYIDVFIFGAFILTYFSNLFYDNMYSIYFLITWFGIRMAYALYFRFTIKNACYLFEKYKMDLEQNNLNILSKYIIEFYKNNILFTFSLFFIRMMSIILHKNIIDFMFQGSNINFNSLEFISKSFAFIQMCYCIGGVLFTKIADVSADLAEMNTSAIDVHQKNNVAIFADNVGDIIGDHQTIFSFIGLIELLMYRKYIFDIAVNLNMLLNIFIMTGGYVFIGVLTFFIMDEFELYDKQDPLSMIKTYFVTSTIFKIIMSFILGDSSILDPRRLFFIGLAKIVYFKLIKYMSTDNQIIDKIARKLNIKESRGLFYNIVSVLGISMLMIFGIYICNLTFSFGGDTAKTCFIELAEILLIDSVGASLDTLGSFYDNALTHKMDTFGNALKFANKIIFSMVNFSMLFTPMSNNVNLNMPVLMCIILGFIILFFVQNVFKISDIVEDKMRKTDMDMEKENLKFIKSICDNICPMAIFMSFLICYASRGGWILSLMNAQGIIYILLLLFTIMGSYWDNIKKRSKELKTKNNGVIIPDLIGDLFKDILSPIMMLSAIMARF